MNSSRSPNRPIRSTTVEAIVHIRRQTRDQQRMRLQILLVATIFLLSAPIPRSPRRNLPRVNWQYFAAHNSDAEFQNSYRVNRGLFQLILNKISNAIESDFIMASTSSLGPISPEIMLAISLRMFAGGRYQDLKRLYSVSSASVYLCFHKVVVAIDNYFNNITLSRGCGW